MKLKVTKISPVLTHLVLAIWSLNSGANDFVSPNGVKEICTAPAKLTAAMIESGDFKKGDLATEEKLCKVDFYNGFGVCPKYSSTNPGLLISHLPEGMTANVFNSEHCHQDDPEQKNIAKFKQSITCSYTPAGLAAYQLSRILGGAGRVPVTVYRTMDAKEHLSKVEQALLELGNSKDAIHAAWYSQKKSHTKKPAKMFLSEDLIYGFLADNIKGEEIYTEVSGKGSYSNRYKRFTEQPAFNRLTSAEPAEALSTSKDLKDLIPMIVQMKDVSDMILMDTLLSQDDRIGNIHFKFRWYYLENGTLKEEKSKAKKASRKKTANYKNNLFEAYVPTEELLLYQDQKQGFLVKEMILKDNDCAVDVDKRSNEMKRTGALEKIRHMSFETYRKFMNLSKYVEANNETVKQHFINELKFRAKDFEGDSKSFLRNLKYATKVLSDNCRSGFLKLDLDKENYLPGMTKTNPSCD